MMLSFMLVYIKVIIFWVHDHFRRFLDSTHCLVIVVVCGHYFKYDLSSYLKINMI